MPNSAAIQHPRSISVASSLGGRACQHFGGKSRLATRIPLLAVNLSAAEKRRKPAMRSLTAVALPFAAAQPWHAARQRARRGACRRQLRQHLSGGGFVVTITHWLRFLLRFAIFNTRR